MTTNFTLVYSILTIERRWQNMSDGHQTQLSLLTDGMVIALRCNCPCGQSEKTTNSMEPWRRCKHSAYDVEIVLTLL